MVSHGDRHHLYIPVSVLISVIAIAQVPLTSARPARFSLASYYGDWMVLQGSPYRAVIWGYSAVDGDSVGLTVPGHANLTTTVRPGAGDHGGVWSFTLPVMEAPGPHNITISSSQGQITLNQVLFGDVWICAGQSNMAFRMEQINNSTLETEAALRYDQIRIFMAAKVQSFTPLYDLHEVSTTWTKPTKESVMSFSAVCLFYAMNIHDRIQRPLGLVLTAWDGTALETWSSPEVLTTCGSQLHQFNNPQEGISTVDTEKWFVPGAHTVLWNAMIHPLLNMTIYGFIWYQGESNTRPEFYKCAFRELIQDWRRAFSQSHEQTSPEFPFGFVQLAPFRQGNVLSHFSGIRWQQTHGYGYVPNPAMRAVFMAVALDLPDFDSPHGALHPRYKKAIGWRLSRAGLAVAYDQPDVAYDQPDVAFDQSDVAYDQPDVLYQGPFPERIDLMADSSLRVDYSGEPLDIRNNTGFEVCCSAKPGSDRACSDIDPSWLQAPIIGFRLSTLTLDIGQCKNIPVTQIRYGWRESPCEYKKCAVYGKASDLPGPPFLLPVPHEIVQCEIHH